MLGSTPELLRLWHCQPDALTTRLDLIQEYNPHICFDTFSQELFKDAELFILSSVKIFFLYRRHKRFCHIFLKRFKKFWEDIQVIFAEVCEDIENDLNLKLKLKSLFPEHHTFWLSCW
jgi:hypothetical protein